MVKQETVRIGNEYDEGLRKRLENVLKSMSAVIESSQRGMAGSQDVEVIRVVIGGKSVLIEAETYLGLSITGDPSLLREIMRQITVLNKATLRNEFSRKRKLLPQDGLAHLNESICLNLSNYLKAKTFQTLHTFLPQINAREVDTFRIITELRKSFPTVRIAAPYIIPGTREMEHFLVTPFTHLVTNQWRIPEPDPTTSEKIRPEEIDIVLVPLLAFDRQGYRVGYGGGYYDRFLPQTRPDCIKMGLSLFEEVDAIEDIDQYDIPLDLCITPERMYDFRN
ncbi:5-formyltetrahydrofolate cyclo-ligase [Dyadobacter sp.]|uniref:5-formyltetrahydrofolate cyclo-ligase n=1 Tax=Dyadobacter sp. TaxID=1914288 RepID=UPI0025BABFFE|nr:5-formyltetrahydrofolate cyclo-ligase [Dyadobacter sp.]